MADMTENGNSKMLIEARAHDLGGGFKVSRILPFAKKRMVGPFIFLDHMGPVEIAANQNTDVRPHPHIGLSTLTFLFDGRMVHRDSLGIVETIVPGEVNWMTAGRGISHSERAHEDDRASKRRLHGLQFWVALPDGKEEIEPSFQHYKADAIPRLETKEHSLKVIAGSAFGLNSPVKTSSPLIFAEVKTKTSSELHCEQPGFELAVYVISGQLEVNGEHIHQLQMETLPVNQALTIKAEANTHYVIIGGVPFSTPRHIWWNLVSSDKSRIERAKTEWRERTFPMVPGETEFIPLPET